MIRLYALNVRAIAKRILLIVFLVLSLTVNLARTQESTSFEYLQLSHLLNQYDEFVAQTGNELLSEYGLSESEIQYFVKGIIKIGRGKLLDSEIVCKGIQGEERRLKKTDSNNNWFFSRATPEDRLAILSKAGPIALWSWLQITEYSEPELTSNNGIQKPSKETMIQLCERVSGIYRAFDTIGASDDQSIKTFVEGLYQKSSKDLKTYVFMPHLAKAKADLYPFQFEVLSMYQRHEAFRNKALELVKSGIAVEHILAEGELAGYFVNVVEANLKRRASLAVVRAIGRLSPATRNKLSSVLEAAGVEHGSLDSAFKALQSMQELDKKAFKNKILQQIEIAKLQHEQVIDKVIKDVNYALSHSKTHVKGAVKQAETVVKDIAKKELAGVLAGTERVCSVENTKLVDLANGPFRWGEMPTKKKPVGYRVKVTPVESLNRNDQSRWYEAKLQLLLWMPDGIHQSDDARCPSSTSPSVRAVDLGFTIADLRRLEGVEDTAKQFVNEASANLVATVSVELKAYQQALESLGIPGGWFSSRPGLSVDRTLQNISLKPNVLDGGMGPDIPIIKDGKFVFDLKEVGSKYCKAIESKYAPNLVTNWAEKIRFQSDELTGYVKADAKVNIEACSLLYPANPEIKNSDNMRGGNSDKYQIKNKDNKWVNDPMQYPRPLDSSALSLTVEMGVRGKIQGEPFDWVGLAALEVDPTGNGNVSLKSFVLGDVPPTIHRLVSKHIRTLDDNFAIRTSNDDAFQLNVRVGSASISESFSISANVLMDVRSDTCRSDLINATVHVPSMTFDLDESQLIQNVKGMIECKGKEVITNLAYNAIDCDSIVSALGYSSLFGLAITQSPEVSLAEKPGKHCALTVEGDLFGTQVKLSNIIASVNGASVQMDFSNMVGLKQLESSAKFYIEDITRPISRAGVEIRDTRVGKEGLSFNIVLNGTPSLNGTKIGPLDIGRIHITYDGRSTFETEIERILVKRLEAVYGPTFERMAMRFAPNQIVASKLNMNFANGKLFVAVDLTIRVYGDITAVATLNIAPRFDGKLDINQKALEQALAGQLLKYIKPLLAFGQEGLTIDDIRYVHNAAMGIGLRTGISINLKQLGTISLSDIYIGSRGLQLNGRAELRIDTFIYLTPVPVPILITEPGVYYDFTQEKVGVLGDFTILEATLAKIAKISGEFSLSDPDKFLEVLSLEGEAVLMDSLPILTTQGEINFAAKRADFQGYTSDLLKKIFSARIQGHVDANLQEIGMDTALSVFGLDLSEGTLQILLKQCPSECITANMNMNIPIGSANVVVSTDPFLVNGTATAAFKLKIDERKIGAANLLVRKFSADLGFNIFGIGVDVSTSGIEDMTPRYIAKIIASLLDIDLQDVLAFLKNPKIKVQPAGSPSSDSKGGDEGNKERDSNEGESKSSSSVTNQRKQSVEAEATQEAEKNGEKKSPEVKATLRNTKGDVFGRYACRDADMSWGFATSYKNGNWSYRPSYQDINPSSWKVICTNNISGEEILKGVFLINDTYRPIRINADIYVYDGEPECDPQGKSCTMVPSYGYEETHIDEKGTQRNNTLMPFVRRISIAGSSEIEANWHELEVKAPETELRTKKKQYQRYIRDTSANASDGVAVRKWVKRLLQSQYSLTVDKISDDIGFPWAFWSNEITLEYKNRVPVQPLVANQYVSVWTKINSDKTRPILSDALLVEHCQMNITYQHKWFGETHTHRYWDMLKSEQSRKQSPGQCKGEHLDVLGDKTADELIQDALSRVSESLSVSPETGEVALDIAEAPVLISNAIAAIVAKRPIQPIGKAIVPDQFVTPKDCNVSSIRTTELERWVKFIPFVKEGGLRKGREFLVAKNGPHRNWLRATKDINGKQTSYRSTMGSLLSCETDPNRWLKLHDLWLGTTLDEAIDTEMPLFGPTLLFEDRSAGGTSDFIKVKQIVGGHPIATFEVQKRLPYNLHHYPDLDRFIYKKVLTLPSTTMQEMAESEWNRIQFIANRNADRDYLIRHVKPRNSDAKIYIEVREYCTDERDADYQCKSSKFLDAPAGHTFTLRESLVGRCMSEIGVIGESQSGLARLKRLLSESDPIVRYGVSPMLVLQSLSNNESFQCN